MIYMTKRQKTLDVPRLATFYVTHGMPFGHISCHANGPNLDAVSTINLFALAKGDEKASLLGTLLEYGAVAP